MADIISPREMWFFTLSSNYPQSSFTVTDIATPITLIPGETKDFLSSSIPNNLNTTEIISASIQIRNYITQGFLISDYLHTHDDKSDINHTHSGLDILTGGSGSVADSLHTHNLSIPEPNFDPYVLKDGSINQVADITSTGDKIEEAVSKTHDKDHTIESHGTLATAENLNTLVDGSNADSLHTHDFSSEVSGSSGTSGTSGNAGYSGVVYRATCTEAAPHLNYIQCSIDTDPVQIANVYCEITGATTGYLDEAVRRLEAGEVMWVIQKDTIWYCVEGFSVSQSEITTTVNDSGMIATTGVLGQIVFNTADSKFYGCTVAGSPATWVALS